MATSTDHAADERFVALETKLAYQEKLLADLNEVIVEHSRALQDLQRRALASEKALRDAIEEKPPQEPPPHY